MIDVPLGRRHPFGGHPFVLVLDPPRSRYPPLVICAQAEEASSCKVRAYLKQRGHVELLSDAVRQAGRGHSARRVFPRNPCCAEGRRSGRVLKIRDGALPPSLSLRGSFARDVPMNRTRSSANFRDSRSRRHAIWKEILLPHCKMQETSKPSRGISLRAACTHLAVCPAPRRRGDGATSACRPARNSRFPAAAATTGYSELLMARRLLSPLRCTNPMFARRSAHAA